VEMTYHCNSAAERCKVRIETGAHPTLGCQILFARTHWPKHAARKVLVQYTYSGSIVFGVFHSDRFSDAERLKVAA
jgi:hypothetical protein